MIKSLQYCYLICVFWSLVIVALFYAFAEQFAVLLASNESVASKSTEYLHIVAISLIGYGWIIVSSAAFNSLGKSVTGLSYYVVRTFALYVPLSLAASMWFDQTWVYIAIAISNLVSGFLVAGYSLLWLKKAKTQDCKPNWSLGLLGQ